MDKISLYTWQLKPKIFYDVDIFNVDFAYFFSLVQNMLVIKCHFYDTWWVCNILYISSYEQDLFENNDALESTDSKLSYFYISYF